MSDVSFFFVFGALAAAAAYFLHRQIYRGEFRIIGRNGWFRREEAPFEWYLALVFDAFFLVLMVLVMLWIAAGSPKLEIIKALSEWVRS